MSVPVEAQSLSKLNYLLTNPPQYPRNPTHEAHAPLILYIVRVPGSQDVFLTPLKPPTKASISLEAIQTSLYYLHVSRPEDEQIKQTFEEEEEAKSNFTTERPSTVHRKPLPNVPHANYPPSRRPLPPPKSYPSYQPGPNGDTEASQLDRYVARGSNVSFGETTNKDLYQIRRKPTGPRRFSTLADTPSGALPLADPSSQSNIEHRQEALRISSDSSDRSISNGSDHTPFVETTLQSSDDSSSPLTAPVYDEHLPPKPQRPDSHNLGNRRYAPVTVIRRDPSSGAQWNIGSISDGGGFTESSLRAVNIELESPGYVKFNGQHDMLQTPTNADASTVKSAIAGTPAGAGIFGHVIEETFVRTVEFRQQTLHGKYSRLQGQSSPMDAVPNFPIQNKPPKSVFSFYSPWHGLCSFSNGIDGRSLKCRHSLPSPNASEDVATANIAELRFNLGWSALRSKDSARNDARWDDRDALPIDQLLKEPRGGKEVLRKGIKHIKAISKDIRDKRARANSTENEPFKPALPPRPSVHEQNQTDDQERVSLRLGREKAGGGYKGNSAKLGKLIIEDEGLKMGDLVVAACMGVWWQHYIDQEY